MKKSAKPPRYPTSKSLERVHLYSSNLSSMIKTKIADLPSYCYFMGIEFSTLEFWTHLKKKSRSYMYIKFKTYSKACP